MKFSDINIRDPFILPDNGVYYLYGSRSHDPAQRYCQTGFDVYTSTDLENWSQPKAIFECTPEFWGERDFWAPEVHRYQGKYYLFATFNSETVGRGTAILISDTPDGPFREHSEGSITPKDWECLDGTLYIDENGTPYMVFCHEWLQIQNGTVCAVELTKDLKAPVGEPVLLWSAGDASWVRDLRGNGSYVTDGPFLFKKDGQLMSIWSSFDKKGYVQAIAKSAGGILGPWTVDYEPLLAGHDGGHGMLFTTFEGVEKFICHQPNKFPNERPTLYTVEDGKFIKD